MTKEHAIQRYTCIWDRLAAYQYMNTQVHPDGTYKVFWNGVEMSAKQLSGHLKAIVEENVKSILNDTPTNNPEI